MAAIVYAVVCVVSYLTTLQHNTRLVATGSKPFKWGYFQSCMSLALSVSLVVYYIDYAQNQYNVEDIVSIFALECLLVGSSVLNLKRYRLGAGLVTLLHLNPMSWMINWMYYRNRWSELRRIRPSPTALPKDDAQTSFTTRRNNGPKKQERRGEAAIERRVRQAVEEDRRNEQRANLDQRIGEAIAKDRLRRSLDATAPEAKWKCKRCGAYNHNLHIYCRNCNAWK